MVILSQIKSLLGDSFSFKKVCEEIQLEQVIYWSELKTSWWTYYILLRNNGFPKMCYKIAVKCPLYRKWDVKIKNGRKIFQSQM